MAKLAENTRFLLIASDGVWEFIKNQKLVDLIYKFYKKRDIEGACDQILNLAIKRWHKEDETVDDITFILVFFN